MTRLLFWSTLFVLVGGANALTGISKYKQEETSAKPTNPGSFLQMESNFNENFDIRQQPSNDGSQHPENQTYIKENMRYAEQTVEDDDVGISCNHMERIRTMQMRAEAKKETDRMQVVLLDVVSNYKSYEVEDLTITRNEETKSYEIDFYLKLPAKFVLLQKYPALVKYTKPVENESSLNLFHFWLYNCDATKPSFPSWSEVFTKCDEVMKGNDALHHWLDTLKEYEEWLKLKHMLQVKKDSEQKLYEVEMGLPFPARKSLGMTGLEKDEERAKRYAIYRATHAAGLRFTNKGDYATVPFTRVSESEEFQQWLNDHKAN